MNGLAEDTIKKVSAILEKLVSDTSSNASNISLCNFVDDSRSFTMELFSQNVSEYLYLSVAKKILESFNTSLHDSLVQIFELLVEAQDGQVINSPAPYDLKFKLKDGDEYWIDIKSGEDLDRPVFGEIAKHRSDAENEGVKYRLCIYDNDGCNTKELKLLAASSEEHSIPYRNKPFCAFPAAEQQEMRAPEFIINSTDSWKLVSGDSNTRKNILKLLNGVANNLSISTIINCTQKRLMQEWRMNE